MTLNEPAILTREHERFWRLHFASSPPLRTRASMAGSVELTDQLIALYLSGKKTAGSSLMRDYEVAGDEFPQVGDFWIVLDSHGFPQVLLKTVRIESHLFRDVSEEIARAEGEGDFSLAYWREAHAKFFAPYLSKLGIKNLQEAEVLTEFFVRVVPRHQPTPN